MRSKSDLIMSLIQDDQQLLRERKEAYEYRKKFYPGAGPTP